jgi:hypothetical protein
LVIATPALQRMIWRRGYFEEADGRHSLRHFQQLKPIDVFLDPDAWMVVAADVLLLFLNGISFHSQTLPSRGRRRRICGGLLRLHG